MRRLGRARDCARCASTQVPTCVIQGACVRATSNAGTRASGCVRVGVRALKSCVRMFSAVRARVGVSARAR
eukprot:3844095-Pleurochrysis_carterae.AAC.3